MSQSGPSSPPGRRSSASRSHSHSHFRFLLLSLVFHLVYISAVFDIYFTSPVVHPQPRFSIPDTFPFGQPAVSNRTLAQFDPPAERLVLVVGDGLRADILFKHHPAPDLPAWATADLATSSRTRSLEQVWHDFDADPLDTHHPYTRALSSDKTSLPSGTAPALPADLQAQPVSAAPFLRSVALHRGVWGLSHTRVPTESRPGHVAMIAGMYEDVSAVTKGWKLNPIAFDSLLNQSSHSFAFGSPDIVPMFAVGAAADRVDMWTYDEDQEDFTKDATALDLWVLDQVKLLFDRARRDPELDARMRRKGTVFFLHLLGLDSTGHTYRPMSPEYIGNTIVVDALVREIERLFDDFYRSDGKTAFVFSADHGMSTKGNHGDGDPDNTRTPILAWGAGIRGPLPASREEAERRTAEAERDAYFQGWQLDGVARVDVDQADITPLMAALIGVPTPANSEGRLRPDLLDLSEEHKARALLANAMQVLETYRVKHEDRQRRMLRYVPFPGLASQPVREGDVARVVPPGKVQVGIILALIGTKGYDAAIAQSEDLIRLALEGSRYLQTYDWLFLCAIVSAGYVGSILYGLAYLLRAFVLSDAQLAALPRAAGTLTGGMGKAVAAPVFGLLCAKFIKEESPLTYYAYSGLACFLWGRAIDERRIFLEAFRGAESGGSGRTGSGGKSWAGVALGGLAGLLMVELMAVGYLYRTAWFVGFLAIGLVWPALSLDVEFKARNEAMLLVWGIACIATGLFTISDVDKEESIPLLVLSGAAFVAAGWLVLVRSEWFFPMPAVAGDRPNTERWAQAHRAHLQRTLQTLKVQLVVLVLTTAVTASSARSLRLKNGLPLPNQVTAWTMLAFSLTFPFVYGFRRPVRIAAPTTPPATTEAGSKHVEDGEVVVRQPPNQRLAIVVFAFAPIFVLLSLRDEALFFGCYTLTLLVWAKMEGAVNEDRLRRSKASRAIDERRPLELADLRISLFYLVFLHVGFFGTGNVASISSFYLSPVYRLVPVFSPFLMATLLLVKILVPFLVLNAVFQALCVTPASPPPPRAQRGGAVNDEVRLVGAGAFGGLGLRGGLLALVFGACMVTDVLALNFLYAVKSEGSWLEIGQTITHFVMANLLQIFMLSLAWISSCIMSGRLDG
ncbi:uncharacterized protein PFL1_06212 [Pseudozyma flocculosa PF-1]|uniref:GPI ethanolamine phosphate transferase 1 n=2 Tax=Pseudozyma flocculosa TaxID=84751 RepID=A0A5C3F6Y8_9BASI|nr:uncharacterized protein PFL1_06212 [Pseudozyma flocculosa PF-1]EPQ26277.1 hypothetical protein PFL1_06212 [Pseudozyma flocculosa PF-1]SPO40238.1 related to MCD4 - sporulation protein [Pseudozyma flocculosa]